MFPIPPNATRIRYLESTGSQYIDMGANVPTSGFVSFNTTVTGGTNAGLWGQQVTGTRILAFFESVSRGYFDRGSSRRIDFSMPEAVVSNAAFGGSDSSIVPRYLFTTATSSGPRSTRAQCRLYSFSIKDANGIPFCDYVPVRIDTTGYLFDRVTGTFLGNARSTKFNLGPDSTIPQGVLPSRMMPMG